MTFSFFMSAGLFILPSLPGELLANVLGSKLAINLCARLPNFGIVDCCVVLNMVSFEGFTDFFVFNRTVRIY